MGVALERDSSMGAARARMVTYFCFIGVWLLVGVVLWAEFLVRVASDSYAEASTILPLLALAAVASGGLLIVFRMSRFPGKMRRLQVVVAVCALLVIGGSFALVPALGVTGAGIAATVGPAFGLAALMLFSQRGPEPIPLSGARILWSVAIGALCLAAGIAAESLPIIFEVGAKVGLTLIYPIALVASGALPMPELRGIVGLVVGRRPGGDRRSVRSAVRDLDGPERDLLEAIAVRGEAAADLARDLGVSEDVVLERFTRLLRSVGSVGEPSLMDADIGRYLVSHGSATKRDMIGHTLSVRPDAVPLDLERLAGVLRLVRVLLGGRRPGVRRGRVSRVPPVKGPPADEP